MSEAKAFFSKISTNYQASDEERACANLLFDADSNIVMGDRRLNKIAALTYNDQQCEKIYRYCDEALICNPVF
jgi:hypothetical protein